ncbi:MotB family protein [Mesorhizobium sp. J428]|uniref:MotB family protein n=1 Tax=Mesorhizobium sp. J428 TaxID=2898440 RepID=UPI0021507E24|nr:MotB family protein [Mesorhizobium sp. J428]MCR5855865.1 MotB family protein [Mesorhizobium sp. J428]
MSTVNHAEPHQEILIIRHGGHDDHDDHHGGAWKIAFADFMTAMMCFFLVMWLINAANEETKAAVASYFNPIKLTDKNASRRGLDEEGQGSTSAQTQAQSETDPAASIAGVGAAETGNMKQEVASESADAEKYTDEHLFSNPYAVLAEIAAETGNLQNLSEKGDGGAQLSGPATGASGGESFRDPFAPDFWSQQIIPGVDSPPAEDNALSEAGDEKTPEAAQRAAQTAEAGKTSDPAAEAEKPAAQAERAPAKPVDPAKASEAVEKQAAEIRKEIAQALGANGKLADGLSVEATPQGVMISVTDQLDFGMFEIGSAVPRRDLVLAMEKIGKILSERSGSLHIYGHTDGRPFAGGQYDNWRLSTARAHSAYYMLVRSGLDEKRLTEVAGFADRKLKVQSDPLAASNRRIEILLEAAG